MFFSGVQLPIKTWHEAISKPIPFIRFPPEMNLWGGGGTKKSKKSKDFHKKI
jgi:hypothetical protein